MAPEEDKNNNNTPSTTTTTSSMFSFRPENSRPRRRPFRRSLTETTATSSKAGFFSLTSSPIFNTTSATSTSKSDATTSTSDDIYAQLLDTKSLNSLFGVPQTTNASTITNSVFGTNATSTPISIFDQPATTTTSSIFSASSVATSSTSTSSNGIFGLTVTTNASPTSNSIFGQAFGTTTKSNAIFAGLPVTTNSTSTPISIFDKPSTTTNSNSFIGTNATSTSNSIFSQQSTTTTKNSNSTFDLPVTISATSTTSNGLFGQQSTTTTTNSNTIFGLPVTTNATSTSSNDIFGLNTTSTNSLFGKPLSSATCYHPRSANPASTNTCAFGPNNVIPESSTASSVFGHTPSYKILNKPQSADASTNTCAFGANNIVPIFYSPNGSSTCAHLIKKEELDVSIKVGSTKASMFFPSYGKEAGKTTRHQCITFMQEHASRSFEEIRFEDYSSSEQGYILPAHNCERCLKDYENSVLQDLQRQCSFHWEVINLDTKTPLLSSVFQPIEKNSKWQLKLENSSLYLINLSSQDVTASFSLSLLNQAHEIIKIRSASNLVFKANGGEHGFADFLVDAQKGRLAILCQVDLDKQHNLRLGEFDRFEKLLGDPEFSDLTLKTDSKIYKLHRCILATCSEKLKDVTEIMDSRVEVLDEFFRFVYTGKVIGILEVAGELLTVAHKYQVQGLKALCEEKMSENLGVNNAVEYLRLALGHGADELRAKTLQWMARNLEKIFHKPEFEEFGLKNPELLFQIMKARFGKDFVSRFSNLKA